jgi:hypothetical protein
MYFSKGSFRAANLRLETIKGWIKKHGWIEQAAVYVYFTGRYTEDGLPIYELFESNTSLEAVRELTAEGHFVTPPSIHVRDLSTEINPNTGKNYTFEEAEAKIDVLNMHHSKKHVIDDIIDIEYNKENPVAIAIRNLANKYNISTNMACDIATNMTGVSRNDYVHSIIYNKDLTKLDEFAEDKARFIDQLYITSPEECKFKDKSRIQSIVSLYNLFNKCGNVDAFKSVLLACSQNRDFQLGLVGKKNTSEIRQYIVKYMMADYTPKAKDRNAYNELMNLPTDVNKFLDKLQKTTKKGFMFNIDKLNFSRNEQ